MDGESLSLVRMLLARLERISADSFLAHRASGIRGSLLRMVEQIENGGQVEGPRMKRLVSHGFRILEDAAMEKTLTSFPGRLESPNVQQAGQERTNKPTGT